MKKYFLYMVECPIDNKLIEPLTNCETCEYCTMYDDNDESINCIYGEKK